MVQSPELPTRPLVSNSGFLLPGAAALEPQITWVFLAELITLWLDPSPSFGVLSFLFIILPLAMLGPGMLRGYLPGWLPLSPGSHLRRSPSPAANYSAGRRLTDRVACCPPMRAMPSVMWCVLILLHALQRTSSWCTRGLGSLGCSPSYPWGLGKLSQWTEGSLVQWVEGPVLKTLLDPFCLLLCPQLMELSGCRAICNPRGYKSYWPIGPATPRKWYPCPQYARDVFLLFSDWLWLLRSQVPGESVRRFRDGRGHRGNIKCSVISFKSSFLFSFLPITISNGFARQEEV